MYHQIRKVILENINDAEAAIVLKVLSEISATAQGESKIFIHLRRGQDYKDSDAHIILPESYYRKAISITDALDPVYVFYVLCLIYVYVFYTQFYILVKLVLE